METKRIADVGFLALSQLIFNCRFNGRQSTHATNRVDAGAYVASMSERGFRLIGHRAPRSVTLSAPSVERLRLEIVCAVLTTTFGVLSLDVELP